MSLSKLNTDESGVPKWQLALAVGGSLLAGAGIYYYLLKNSNQAPKDPKVAKKSVDSVDSPASTSENDKRADDPVAQVDKNYYSFMIYYILND